MASRTLTTDQRKEIFLNLVETQDALNSDSNEVTLLDDALEESDSDQRIPYVGHIRLGIDDGLPGVRISARAERERRDAAGCGDDDCLAARGLH